MRLAFYAGASTAAAAACLLKAFHERPNFYSATVYLSQSNACLLILTNLLLMLACTFIYGLQRLLYGPLRPIEIEQLSEKAWYAVLDTLLAMPSFREDVGGWLLTMFVLLLAGKVWGWIGEGRVDILEQQPPANPRLFHARLATSLVVSVMFDAYMLNYCIETVMADPRPGMMVIFTFEFAILTIFSTFTLSRYLMTVAEILMQKKQMKLAIEVRKNEIRAERALARQNETADGSPTPASPPNEEPIEVDENDVDIPGWEEKRRWLFILEVLTDFIKLIIYVVFFTVSITFNGLPMHIMRDVYMTFASFSKRVTDYVAYRKATSDMNTRYPDATTEEIRGDACIVCRESMVAWEQPNGAPPQPAGDQGVPAAAQPVIPARRDEGLRAKKLPCGHILHLRCLKAWLERQQVCPTCRRPVVTASTQNQAQGQAGGQQPAGPGANGQAPAPPPQPRAPRPGRARWINLGPIRLGFLNGPGDQIQNIVDQLRNQQAVQNNAPNPNQEGPNHLGLQVPYANTNNGGAQPTTTSARSTLPAQIQIMQLEQRLMQEAHNLGLEQQQLHNLRMMEAEMARLRALHIPANRPVGTETAAQRQQTLPIPLGLPALPGTSQSSVATPLRSGQPLSSGHENLPEGLTLPQGWTLTPLHQLNPPFPQTQPPQARDVGPTDDRGSPLFVPTTAAMVSTPVQQQSSTPIQQQSSAPIQQQPSQLPQAAAQPTESNTQSNGNAVSSASATVQSATPRSETVEPSIPAQSLETKPANVPTPSIAQPQPQPNGTDTSTQAESPSHNMPENKAPWTENGWSFDNTSSSSPAESQTYTGKGKARAVEVEDVPDPES